MFVPSRLPDQEANCSLRKYDILMDPFKAACLGGIPCPRMGKTVISALRPAAQPAYGANLGCFSGGIIHKFLPQCFELVGRVRDALRELFVAGDIRIAAEQNLSFLQSVIL